MELLSNTYINIAKLSNLSLARYWTAASPFEVVNSSKKYKKVTFRTLLESNRSLSKYFRVLDAADLIRVTVSCVTYQKKVTGGS